jgi:hypothetical protein
VITKITANIILLVMAGVWAWLSVSSGQIVEVGDKFVWLAVALASGEGIGEVVSKLGMAVPVRRSNDSVRP